MSDDASPFESRLEELRRIRDEIRVKAHLGKLEAEEAWGQLEEKWEDLEARASQLGRESEDALEEVRSAAGLLVQELGEAYRDIKRRLLS